MSTKQCSSKAVVNTMRRNKKGQLKIVKTHVKRYTINSFKKRK